jgi:hypothetical protein
LAIHPKALERSPGARERETERPLPHLARSGDCLTRS